MATSTPTSAASGRLTSAVQQLEGDRVVGLTGAVLVLVATGLDWYAQPVTVTLGELTQHSTTGSSLWDVRNVAAWALVAGAAIGAIALLLKSGREWRGGMAAAAAGLGVMVYSLVAMVDLPAVATGTLGLGGAVVSVVTRIDVGPFVALLGGFLLLVGGLSATRDAAPFARQA
jgi:hypothetical protein